MSNNGAVHQEVTEIPDMDGTGPRWLGERKFSRLGRWNFPDNIYNLPDSSIMMKEEGGVTDDQKPTYGEGLGKFPLRSRRRMCRR